MSIRVAINGFGRIGRNVMRAHHESPYRKEMEIVAINDLADRNTNAHLLQYDTVHGKFAGEVNVVDDGFTVDGALVKTLSERVPANLPWGDLGVDVVLESTGFFASKEKASGHLEAGRLQSGVVGTGQKCGRDGGIRSQSRCSPSRTPGDLKCILHYKLSCSDCKGLE